MSIFSSSIHPFKVSIIKYILKQKKYHPLAIVNTKLFSASESLKTFFYSNIEGALCFIIDILNKEYKFILYDTITYKEQLIINLLPQFAANYKKIEKYFHAIQISNNFFGFYLIENDKILDDFYTLISTKVNEKELEKNLMELSSKVPIFADNPEIGNTNNDSEKYIENKEKIINKMKEKLKENFDENFVVGEGVNINIKKPIKEIKFYNNNQVNEIIDNIVVNKNTNDIEFYYNKNTYKKLLDKNHIKEEDIKLINNSNLDIGNKDLFVHLLTNHMINDMKTLKNITQIRIKNKDKIMEIKKKKEEEEEINKRELEEIKEHYEDDDDE